MPRWIALLVTAVALLPLALPAHATYATLKRSLGNIVFAPFDLALSPVVATQTLATNLEQTDDPLAVRIVFVPIGLVWNTGVQGMAAVVREVSGLLEFLPGIAVLPLRVDVDPIYAPVERGNALIDKDTAALRFKLGVDYMTVPY